MAEVSIIIPTFNRAHLLKETLDSIKLQSFKNWECIVIDDGSTDETEDLLNTYEEEDKRFKYYRRPENRKKGANTCRNYGFERSTGNFILWYDSDDILKPEKLEIQLAALQEAKTDFCVAFSEVFDDQTGKKIGLRFDELNSNNLMLDYARMKLGWMTPSILWSKRYLNKLNKLFDEELQAAQEWEFHLRIIAQKPNFCIVEKSLDLIRKHDLSITYNTQDPERKWFYFMARLKIYRNKDLQLNDQTRSYLKKYIWSHFKEMVRLKDKFAFKAYEKLILTEVKLSFIDRFLVLISIISFRLFGRGDILLKKVKY